MSENTAFNPDVIIGKVKWVIMDPRGYFQQMPRSGGYVEPMVFIAIMAAVLGVISAVWALFGATTGVVAGGFFAALIFTPIAAVIGAFIGAAILFVIWKLMGSDENYETAFRCQSSVAAIYPIVGIVSIVPYVGNILAIAWGAFLMIEASVQVHGRSRKLATTVFGILAVLMILSNTAGERASRNMAERMENMGTQFEGYEEMSPEEAGRKMGEFLRGMEEAQKKNNG
ncbi:MAG: YIP1 family protein [Chromatocurvus sp.]